MDRVGERFRLEGDKGKILYYGTVASSKKPDTMFYGVEWDNEGRGNHDGAVTTDTGEEVRHFTCRAGRGSFVRSKRMKFGCTLVDAIREKYAPEDRTEEKFSMPIQRQSGSFEQPILFVGQDKVYAKQSQLHKLRRVLCVGSQVSSVGKTPDELKTTCPAMRELILEDNLVDSWEFVDELLQQLPLTEINLNKNAVRLETLKVERFQESMQHLRILRLVGVPGAWNAAFSLASHDCLSHLEELTLCEISKSEFSLTPKEIADAFPRLKLIDLSYNKFTSWSNLEALSALPSLETLMVTHNKLEDFSRTAKSEAEAGVDDAAFFSSLKSLWITDNSINSLEFLDLLNRIPKLDDIRCTNNPIGEKIGGLALRQLTIGHVDGLMTVNKSEVTTRERIDCERFYVRFFQTPENRQLASSAMLTRQGVLATKHSIDSDVKSTAEPDAGQAMASNFADVTIRSMDPNSIASPPLTKKLPLSMKVGAVKALCRRKFKLAPAQQALGFRETASEFPMPLDDDFKSLSYYGVCSGGEILMQLVD